MCKNCAESSPKKMNQKAEFFTYLMKIQVFLKCLPKFKKKNIEINVSPWHNHCMVLSEEKTPALLKSNPEKGRREPRDPPEKLTQGR